MYHRSVSFRSSGIVRSGLKNPYLTSFLDLALVFARSRSLDFGGQPVVYGFTADPLRLKYDNQAMDCPLAHDGKTIDTHRPANQTLEEYAKKNPETVQKDGKMIVPDNEYLLSLEAVNCCAYTGIVTYSNLLIVGGE
ncbi:hypothetical protein [Paenibacillus periandrae]|uniref:hypothetical protein n=1 Tax=Paenibacillus periandrae TaxID=1761741 RepID=UPI001F093D25|nr:hypothetical protein [Paenibacillus periandrae]